MAKQLHKRLSTQEVKALFQKYLYEGIELVYILEILQIAKRRFFQLLKEYKRDPNNFSLQYKRKSATRRISADVEKSIINELKEEKKLIEDKDISTTSYNYSYIKDRICEDYKQKVSLPTIINKAKKEGFYKPKKRKKRAHDREVHSNYIGELIQHDSSYHKFSPYADKKWYLITSIDDYSRLLLYAKLVEKETF
ncbi:unnamed protein product, partial [marine sediment metagenome]